MLDFCFEQGSSEAEGRAVVMDFASTTKREQRIFWGLVRGPLVHVRKIAGLRKKIKKIKVFFLMVQVGDGVSELVLSCSRGLTSSHVRAFLRSCPNIRR